MLCIWYRLMDAGDTFVGINKRLLVIHIVRDGVIVLQHELKLLRTNRKDSDVGQVILQNRCNSNEVPYLFYSQNETKYFSPFCLLKNIN
jgi:hypothetical protein